MNAWTHKCITLLFKKGSHLPDGEFLSFDSILKSFFSSSVKNVLSPHSGQHPSTVFTCSPSLLLAHALLSLSSFFFFCLSFSLEGSCLRGVTAGTVVLLSVGALLAGNWQHGCCSAAKKGKNPNKETDITSFSWSMQSIKAQWVCMNVKRQLNKTRWSSSSGWLCLTNSSPLRPFWLPLEVSVLQSSD